MKYVKDNRRIYDKIMNEFRSLSGAKITIGLHDDLGVHPSENNESNLTVAQIGVIQEFGATVRHPDGKPITIPSRPFTSRTFDSNQSKILSDLKQVQAALTNGADVRKHLQYVGDNHAARQRKAMTEWATPPNSPRTVKHKGFNDPLVDSGLMIKSVKSKVKI